MVPKAASVQVKFGKRVLGGASHPATFARVYDVCGPTFPYQYDSEKSAYLLRYQGLLCLFPFPFQHASHFQLKPGDSPLNFPDAASPVASRICVHALPPTGDIPFLCITC